MKANNKSIVGWMSLRELKRARRGMWIKDLDINSSVDIFRKKGNKEFWGDDWPPVKVKLTIEWEE